MIQYLSEFLRAFERFLHIRGLHSYIRNIYRSVRYYLCVRGIIPFRVRLLVISVGQACNYKCRDCGNFAPYAPAKFRRYSFDDLREWITRFVQCTDGINKIQIQGGEPFLYSDLGKLIQFLHELRIRGGGVIVDIDIATNGSILPGDELISIIKSAGVHVRISDYNITPGTAQELVRKLQENNIPYSIYTFAGRNGRWYNCGGVSLSQYAPSDDKTAEERYRHCSFSGCLTLERGQLARCSRGNNAPEIQGFTSRKGDYIVLSDYEDSHELRKALINYCVLPTFMEACRHCNGTNESDMVDAAVQIQDM